MDFRHKVVKAIFWSATQNWGGKAISFLVFLVLSRLLEPEAFGLVALAYTFTTFAQIFLDQGFSDAIVQRAELERKHLDTAFWIGVLTGSLLMAIGVAGSRWMAGFFNQPQLAPIISWLSLSFLLAALSGTQQAYLRRELAFQSLAVRSLVGAAISGIIGVSMAFAGWGVWSLVAQNLVNGLVGAIILWRASRWRPGFNFSKKHFKDLFGFGLSTVGAKIVDFFNRRADDLLIGYFLGPTALGYYTIAYRLLLMMIELLTSVTNLVSFSAFSRLQHNPEQMRRAFYKVTQYTSLISFPAFLGILIIAPEMVPALFGSKWSPSIPVMQILALIGILQSVSYFNGSVLRAAGKPSWRLGILLLNAICNVTGFLLVVRWGIVAVAAVYVIIGYLLSPIYLLTVHSLIHINFRTYFGQYVEPLIGSLAMVIIVAGLRYILGEELDVYVRLFSYTLIGGLTYVLVLQLTAPTLSHQVLELVITFFQQLSTFIGFSPIH